MQLQLGRTHRGDAPQQGIESTSSSTRRSGVLCIIKRESLRFFTRKIQQPHRQVATCSLSMLSRIAWQTCAHAMCASIELALFEEGGITSSSCANPADAHASRQA